MAIEAVEIDLNRLEEGQAAIQEAVDKIIRVAEGIEDDNFTPEEYMRYYTIVYDLCNPNPRGNFSKQFYDQYKKIIEEYITAKVLPSLNGKREENLLKELVRTWAIYKSLTRWVSRFFHYLDRYFIPRKKLPSLADTSFMTFYNLVCGEMNCQIRDAVISMINREREGKQIDEDLVKSILDFYVEVGMHSMKYYEQVFEKAMLEDATTFYSQKASEWMQNKSYEDYMLMAEQCLKREKDTALSYLQPSTQKKLLEVVEYELLNVHAHELEQKKLHRQADEQV